MSYLFKLKERLEENLEGFSLSGMTNNGLSDGTLNQVILKFKDMKGKLGASIWSAGY